MEIRRLLDPAPAAPLFAGWPETMIWSCLHGCIGQAYSNGSDLPQSARIDVGDFSFFAGAPDAGLVLDLLPPGFRILVPREAHGRPASKQPVPTPGHGPGTPRKRIPAYLIAPISPA